MNAAAIKNWTVSEFERNYGGERVELVDGEIRELPMPDANHGKVALKLAVKIGVYLEANDIGHLSGLDSFVKVRANPLKIRGADLCFYSYLRLPRGPIPRGVIPNVPELVIEVVSPSDRDEEIQEKVADYLHANVVAVVYIDPEQRSAKIYRTGELDVTLDNGDDLEFPDILPGFRVKLASLFA